jgi:hypothetical protein
MQWHGGVMMIAVLVGSIVGGLVPSLWGAGLLSAAGVVFSLIGAAAGIWAGARIGEGLSCPERGSTRSLHA